MCQIDYCDERVLVLSENIRQARKEHKCAECNRAIEPGEKYLVESYIYDGEFTMHKTCTHCQVARDWLAKECGGWLYSGVYEDIREHVSEGCYGLPVARLAAGMRRRWRLRDQKLMPIPRLPLTSIEKVAYNDQTGGE